MTTTFDDAVVQRRLVGGCLNGRVIEMRAATTCLIIPRIPDWTDARGTFGFQEVRYYRRTLSNGYVYFGWGNPKKFRQFKVYKPC